MEYIGLKVILWIVALLMSAVFFLQLLHLALVASSPRILREKAEVSFIPPLLAALCFYVLTQLP